MSMQESRRKFLFSLAYAAGALLIPSCYGQGTPETSNDPESEVPSSHVKFLTNLGDFSIPTSIIAQIATRSNSLNVFRAANLTLSNSAFRIASQALNKSLPAAGISLLIIEGYANEKTLPFMQLLTTMANSTQSTFEGTPNLFFNVNTNEVVCVANCAGTPNRQPAIPDLTIDQQNLQKLNEEIKAKQQANANSSYVARATDRGYSLSEEYNGTSNFDKKPTPGVDDCAGGFEKTIEAVDSLLDDKSVSDELYEAITALRRQNNPSYSVTENTLILEHLKSFKPAIIDQSSGTVFEGNWGDTHQKIATSNGVTRLVGTNYLSNHYVSCAVVEFRSLENVKVLIETGYTHITATDIKSTSSSGYLAMNNNMEWITSDPNDPYRTCTRPSSYK